MTSAEVAVLFRVDAKTVTEWVRTGRIRYVRTPGGSYRFRESDVQALLDQTSGPGALSPPAPGPDPTTTTPGE